jgi:hypothetical protein
MNALIVPSPIAIPPEPTDVQPLNSIPSPIRNEEFDTVHCVPLDV